MLGLLKCLEQRFWNFVRLDFFCRVISSALKCRHSPISKSCPSLRSSLNCFHTRKLPPLGWSWGSGFGAGWDLKWELYRLARLAGKTVGFSFHVLGQRFPTWDPGSSLRSPWSPAFPFLPYPSRYSYSCSCAEGKAETFPITRSLIQHGGTKTSLKAVCREGSALLWHVLALL